MLFTEGTASIVLMVFSLSAAIGLFGKRGIFMTWGFASTLKVNVGAPAAGAAAGSSSSSESESSEKADGGAKVRGVVVQDLSSFILR